MKRGLSIYDLPSSSRHVLAYDSLASMAGPMLDIGVNQAIESFLLLLVNMEGLACTCNKSKVTFSKKCKDEPKHFGRNIAMDCGGLVVVTVRVLLLVPLEGPTVENQINTVFSHMSYHEC